MYVRILPNVEQTYKKWQHTCRPNSGTSFYRTKQKPAINTSAVIIVKLEFGDTSTRRQTGFWEWGSAWKPGCCQIHVVASVMWSYVESFLKCLIGDCHMCLHACLSCFDMICCAVDVLLCRWLQTTPDDSRWLQIASDGSSWFRLLPGDSRCLLWSPDD